MNNNSGALKDDNNATGPSNSGTTIKNNKDLIQRIKNKLMKVKNLSKNPPKTILSSVSTVNHAPRTTTLLKKSVLGHPPAEKEDSDCTHDTLMGEEDGGPPYTPSEYELDVETDPWDKPTPQLEREVRMIGSKSERQEEEPTTILASNHKNKDDLLMMMFQASERRELAQEKKFERLVEEVSFLRNELRSSSKASEDGETLQRDNVGSIIKKDRATHETSRGEYLADTLLGEAIPASWPEYKWPKSWDGGVTLASALISLRDLQNTHYEIARRKAQEPNPFTGLVLGDKLSPEEERKKLMRKALESALHELRGHLRQLERGLKYTEFEIIEPILEGCKGDYPLEHKAWEICLKGFAEYPVWITDHLHAARKVSPNLMKTTGDWFSVISGGEWPTASSRGFMTGMPKKSTKKNFGGNVAGSNAAPNSSSTNESKQDRKKRELKEREAKKKAEKETGSVAKESGNH